MRVAIIGANGFVGRAISKVLAQKGHVVVAIIREREVLKLTGVKTIVHIDNADSFEDWTSLLAGMDVVIQLASPVSVDKTNFQQAKEYKKIIVEGTLSIAKAAAKNSLQRMIFISSIKANGEITKHTSFKTGSIPDPKTCYGKSKLEAELGLSVISDKYHLPITLVRPPVIYGPGNRGNIYSLIKLLTVVPSYLLPFGNIRNKRSLLFIDNLVSALVSCIEDDSDKSHLFLLRDPVMLSTGELCHLILAILGKDSHIGADYRDIITTIIKFIMPRLTSRLYGSLEIDDSAIFDALGWKPPFNTEEGLSKTISFIQNGRRV